MLWAMASRGSRAATSGRFGSILVGLVLGTLVRPAIATPGVTELVSISTDGQQGDNISGRFAPPAISGNGQVVAFDSIATTLVPDDTNDRADVFVHDISTGVTQRVSVSSTGEQAHNISTRPDIDASGNMVAFDSFAGNLVPRDNNRQLDVFVHDRATGQTIRASVSSTEAQADAQSHSPSINASGRFVAFVSSASNLVPSDTNGTEDIFVRDLVEGTTERVSLRSNGAEANSSSTSVSISANGRWVAFASFASNLVRGDTNEHFDVFLHDRVTGRTRRVSVGFDERQANAPSTGPAVSRHGELVAFRSTATNLVPDDTNERQDVFVRDTSSGTTVRVSVNSSEEEADGGSQETSGTGYPAAGPEITPDGRFVAFHSTATNLVAGDTNTCPPFFDSDPGRCPDVFVRDLVAGTTVRVNVASDGSQTNERSSSPSISADGQAVAFFSAASNLVPDDDNVCPPLFTQPGTCPDIFVHDQT
jgi:Tol biopolymer transport system component